MGPRSVLKTARANSADPGAEKSVARVSLFWVWEIAVKKDPSTEVMPGRASSADAALAADPLPSWNDGPAKQSIFSFVETVTQEGSPSFIPVPERIATFDNDGTLWCETPVPVQVYFAQIGRASCRERV